MQLLSSTAPSSEQQHGRFFRRQLRLEQPLYRFSSYAAAFYDARPTRERRRNSVSETTLSELRAVLLPLRASERGAFAARRHYRRRRSSSAEQLQRDDTNVVGAAAQSSAQYQRGARAHSTCFCLKTVLSSTLSLRTYAQS